MKSNPAMSACEPTLRNEPVPEVAAPRSISPFHVLPGDGGADSYRREIARILRRQEMARIGFVAACVAVCALISIALWHLWNS
jgi:hypothetical protein